jgi:hypothetical protein
MAREFDRQTEGSNWTGTHESLSARKRASNVDIFCRPAHEFLQIIIQVHFSIFE